jgi:hypothetical protein
MASEDFPAPSEGFVLIQFIATRRTRPRSWSGDLYHHGWPPGVAGRGGAGVSPL